MQDLGISSGEFKRIKFYIENLKNKYDEKVKECEKLEKQIKQLKDTIKKEKEAGYSIIERLL